MYEFLNVSGRLVSIASKSWQTGQQKLQKDFRDWLEEVGGEVEEVEAGAFKESGTNVATVIITIDK
jgi:acetylornithine deacetylase/succinyl-diaminopimelate desuccinylase-like protein